MKILKKHEHEHDGDGAVRITAIDGQRFQTNEDVEQTVRNEDGAPEFKSVPGKWYQLAKYENRTITLNGKPCHIADLKNGDQLSEAPIKIDSHGVEKPRRKIDEGEIEGIVRQREDSPEAYAGGGFVVTGLHVSRPEADVPGINKAQPVNKSQKDAHEAHRDLGLSRDSDGNNNKSVPIPGSPVSDAGDVPTTERSTLAGQPHVGHVPHGPATRTRGK